MMSLVSTPSAGPTRRLVLSLICIVLPKLAQAQQPRGGASLLLEGALSALYDTNVRQDNSELDMYGGRFDLLARFANRPISPVFQLEYGAGRRASSPTTVHDIMTHRVGALLAMSLRAGARLELIGRGVSGGVDEDLNQQREASVLPRLEWELNRHNRLRLYTSRTWRDEGGNPTPTVGSMLGGEYRRRFGSAVTLQFGFRSETHTPADSVYSWRREGVTTDFALRTGARSAFELGARYRVRSYPNRLVTIDGEPVIRRDDERRASASWVFRSRTGTELRAGWEYEVRTSNDTRRNFDAHRTVLSFRQPIARWGGRTNVRFDEDRWDLTAERAPTAFDHVTTVGSAVCGMSGGRAHCWAGTSEAAPPASGAVTVPGGGEWLQLAAGQVQMCGLTRSGAAYCWRVSGDGRPYNPPAAVHSQQAFHSIVVGHEHACALDSADAAFCWGVNRDGALGDGTLVDSFAPVEAARDHRFRMLATGARHTCGLTAESAVFCWGANNQGQLGRPHGQRFVEAQRVVVPLLVSISAGTSHTCGVDGDGAAWCWGENGRGQLGIGSAGAPAGPTRVSTSIGFASISAGWAHTCALSDDGRAFCWGQNRYGQLGLPADGASHVTPVPVMPQLRFTSLSASFRTCAITTGGRVVCWGADANHAVTSAH